ncbi:MAG: CopD family protein, partial [Micromonosporaceae bacterium]|nr:CopD family protein [Micromonosporaceae bacterium]
ALWPKRLDRTGPTRMAYLGLGIAAFGTLAELYLEAPYSTGAGLFGAAGSDLVDVLTSQYGVLHLIRLGVLAAAALLLRPHLAGRTATGPDGTGPSPAGKAILTGVVLLGVAGVATFSLAGHPDSSTAPALTVIADVAHLGSAAIWIGGLLVLFGFLLRKANEGELREILPVWSNWAMLAVGVLVLAGTAQALVEIGSLGALLHTGYGQLVLAKVGLLAVVLAVAWFSRRLVGRTPEPATVGRLRRTVLAEVLGAVVILGLASVLVQTAPARTAAAAASPTGQQAASGSFSTTVTTTLYQLEFDLSRSPGNAGDYDIHLYAATPQGVPLKVVEWQASAALPAKGIEPISIPLLPETDDHASGQINLPSPGNWTFQFTLRTSDVDEATTSTTVPVS